MAQFAVQDATYQAGRVVVAFTGTIARTDTTAKTLFTLPGSCIPLSLSYCSPAASNAGKSGGTGTEYLNAADVKTAATGAGQVVPGGPASTLLGQLAASQVVTGIYAETGGASNTGGPWVVTILAIP